MLIVTRRVGEAVMIGDEVRVTVLAVRGRQVRLGVRSPAVLPVDREEVYLLKLQTAGDPPPPAAGGA